MVEDTRDGSRTGRYGSVKYDSTKKGAKKKSKPWGKRR